MSGCRICGDYLHCENVVRGENVCKWCAIIEARKLAEEFASEITRLRCNRTDTTAFSGRPKLPWEEK